VTFRDLVTHTDERGTLFELFDPRWGWHDDPVVSTYVFTVRPGVAKGWALHREEEHRYAMIQGELLVVLYDERPDSPTYGLVSEIFLSEHRRRLMSIPKSVWHAVRNVGSGDAMVVNFATATFDHANPDKYRLPLNNDRIPYVFEGVHGG
jgi:dTDP-4-dehydrorhamnose 3,5-epimerase